jgi:monothiol glutaredoxin
MSTFRIPELTVRQTTDRLKTDASARLIDVRTDEEYAIAHIAGAILMNTEERLQALLGLPRNTPLIVHCHHGVRSLSGAGFLMDRGFTEVYSMAGGIDAWSSEIDPAVPHY